jgi:hypothetical protein
MSIDFSQINEDKEKETQQTPVPETTQNQKIEFVGSVSDTFYKSLNQIFALEGIGQLNRIHVHKTLETPDTTDTDFIMVTDEQMLDNKKLFIEQFNTAVALIKRKKLRSMIVNATNATTPVSSLVNLCTESNVPVYYSVSKLRDSLCS